jgi:integrase/recombinase XerC
MATRTALQRIPRGDFDAATLRSAIALWSDSTTDAASARRQDLVRDKSRSVEGFFTFSGKRPADVTSLDVKRWQREFERRGLKPASVYSKVSKLSSFYTWAIAKTPLRKVMQENPVRLARPKAPPAYRSESTRALDDDQARALVAAVGLRAAADGALAAKRDYALLLFYMLTGMRRAEVIGLRGKDVRFKDGALVIRSKVKGGDFVAREIRDPLIRFALVDYLTACRRRSAIGRDLPLWLRHDQGCEAVERHKTLTSHAFVRNLKLYAEEAGIGSLHLHQLRHTYARMVAESSGSLTETQEALGHRHLSTTRVYVQRVGVKRDRFSSMIATRLRL